MDKKRHGKRFIIQNHLGDFVRGTDQSGNPTLTDEKDKALGFSTRQEAEYWAMDKKVMGFDIQKYDPTHSGTPPMRGSVPAETGRGPGDIVRGENTRDKLKEIVKEEIKKLFENDDKTEAMDENLEKLDEVKRSLNRLRSSVSDDAWKGYFTRGDMEDMEGKFKQIEEILKEIEGIIINERGRR